MAEEEANSKLNKTDIDYHKMRKQFLESTGGYSTFGRRTLSTDQGAPAFGFGSSDRFQISRKQYISEDLSRSAVLGRHGPGPMYKVKDRSKYRKSPSWSLGTSMRDTFRSKPKYEHYNNSFLFEDPIRADSMRRPRTRAPKLSTTETRSFGEQRERSPGPVYYPSEEGVRKSDGKYSFGYRREVRGQSPLMAHNATPNLVGPGRYDTRRVETTSKKAKAPTWSLPKASRTNRSFSSCERNQTYRNDYSCGKQITSRRKNSPNCTFGSARRDNERLGQFAENSFAVKVNLQHV
mmetsp:Transcript_61106/g.69989  ORF Transcript_61106/g.69989 Transcript_61106/m.69989 type:complete len:292 (-) Transcript_61106:1595-2470(-)